MLAAIPPAAFWMTLSRAACGLILGGTIAAAAATAAVDYEFAVAPQDGRAWLANQGFALKLDAGDASRARLALGSRGLTIETLAPAEPLIAHPGLNVAEPARLSVTWGVDRYPAGANWDIGANNEAVMVMVSFGAEKLSGGLFLPPSPYFIGFFLCENGRRHVAIKGRSYTMQGRYVCLDGPASGREITSVVKLADAFHDAFHTAAAPPVTGVAFEADTTEVGPNGRSSAWIRSLKIAPAE